MESILLAQHEITTNISQLLSNYKKDGNNRKTKNYLEKKIAYVKAAQREFIANDDKILAISPPIGNSHPYRSTRKTTQEECTWLLADMRQRLNAGPPSTPTGSSVWATDSQPDSNDDFHLESRQASPEPTLHVDNQQSNTSPPCEKFGSTSHYNKHQETTTKPLNTTFKRQDFYMRQLHQEIFAIEGRLDNETCPKEYLQLKVNQLQGQMNDIYQLHATIMVETDEEDKTTNYFVQDYYGTIKNRAETMIIRLQQCQGLAERLTSKPHVEQKVKLPQVELPSFYGDYEKWTSFRDLFIEVIHNNDGLSNTVKMTYLKSKLQKGASQLIAHLATTGENYNMAWASIKARYDNKRLLSNNYFNSLLSMPTAQQATGPAIRSMHDTLKEVLHNIQQLNLESSFEAFIVFLVTKRLDPESIRLFEANLQQPKEIPTLHVLFDFLERRFQSLDAMGKERHITTPRQAVAQPLKRVNIATASVQCVVPDCHGNHKLETCPWFKKMPTLERAKLVSHLQLCVRCLESHQKSRCSTTEICVVCNGKHNTLLHCNNSASKTEKASKTFVVQQTSAVLLPTAIVQASTANGQLVTLRALIDPGSQATLISSKAVNRFDFKKKKSNIKITGIGGQAAGICKHSVNTTLSPNFPGNFTLAIEALVFDNLDHQLPRDKIDDSKWTHLGRLKLADPRFNHPQPIDLIIGADYYTFIAISNIIKSGPNDPMAQETELGWILMGNLGQSSEEKFTMVTTKSIENQLKLLVENDNFPDERIRTEEEQRAEEHFSSTVQRNRDGRYTVRIPFKEDPPQLGESKKTATARLLQQDSTQWDLPRNIKQNIEMDQQVYPSEDYEEKTTLTATTNLTNVWLELFQRISSYDKLKRVVAHCATFINRVTSKIPAIKAITAETIIFRMSQEEDFHQELRYLRDTQRLPNNSKLSSLNPFLDDNGILRMRGRLQNANILAATKNPIILGKNNPITRKLIERAHKLMLHGGVQLTLSHLRDRYWILDGRRAVRFVIKKCVICFRHQQQHASQLMGDLPASRVWPGRPFAKTGIDYAGPIQLRTTKGRGHKSYKGYIALFVCMVTKAVHIEIVSSLTTDAFIAAYQRFTSRRGLCTDLYSDNGTYFVGADAEMKKNRIALTTLPIEVANAISIGETTWHFIPPFAPQFGGLWEAGIKSVKGHLKRIIGTTTLTFEELSTVTAQIEACLNSRPLTPLTNDPSDLNALTPGHFLIGEALKSQPSAMAENIPLTTRWHLIQRMIQDFWKRWSAEYLHQLQQRSKWKTPQPNLLINDLVLLRDDQLPATYWKLGRIIETQAGTDGLVRVATVKCKDNVYKRPITRLCKLPIEAKTINIPELETTNDEAPPIRKQPPRRAKRGLKVNNLALLLFSVCTILGLTRGITIISPFDHPSGIHFEEMGTLEAVAMKWKLVIFYNLTDYWKEVENCKQAVIQLQEACSDLSGFNCDTTLQHLQWRLNNLIAENNLLKDSNKERKRSKRGLGDTLGIALGDVFGILSQRDATQYESQFEMINSNENHLMQLMQNQTSIIDNTIKLIKHNSNLTTMSINNLLQEQMRLKQELIVLQEYRSYEDRVRSVLMNLIELTLILQNLEDTQHCLLDIVYSAHREILHPTILTPDQLEDQLSLIRQHVPTVINVPGHQLSDLIHVYQSLTVRSRMTKQNVIIEIIIPLAFATEYTLLSVISVPDILHDNTQSSIVTSTEYLAMDNHREHFAFFSTEQLSRCQIISSSHFLCEASPIFNAFTNNGRCEVAILQRKSALEQFCNFKTSNSRNRWIPLHAPNQWIYAVPYETTVDVLCGSQSSPNTLQGSGIISIDAGCILRDKDLYIVAVGTASNAISKAFHKSNLGITTSKQLKNLGNHIKGKVRDDAASGLIPVLDTKKLKDEI